jgi:MFS transporter, DHA1 family, multidrug resistance protein
MMSTLSARLIRLAAQRPRPRSAAVLGALVCALFFVSGVAQTAIVPLLPRMSVHYGLSSSEAALVLALPGLAMLAISLPAGVLADRFGVRRVTLAAGALLAIGCLAQAVPSLPALLAGRLAYGLSFGVLWTAGAAWLTSLGEGAGRVGPAVILSSVGTMVGPALGGLLAHGSSATLPFAAIAVAGIVVTAVLAAAPRPRVASASGHHAAQDTLPLGDAPHVPTGAPEGAPAAAPLRRLLGQARQIRVASAAGSLVVVGALSGVTQLLISSGLHADGVSQGKIGLAFSACALGYILASATFVRLGPRAHTLQINALVTGLGAIALLPALLGSSPAVLVGALMLTAAPRGAINVIAYALPGNAGGSVFGLLNGAWGAASVLMPLSAGALVQHDGARAGYLAVIVPALAVTLLLCLALPRDERRSALSRGLGRLGLRTRGRARAVDDLQPAQLRQGDVAADAVPGLLFDELGLGGLADLPELARAARLEGAARRRRRRGRDLALEPDTETFEVIQVRHR